MIRAARAISHGRPERQDSSEPSVYTTPYNLLCNFIKIRRFVTRNARRQRRFEDKEKRVARRGRTIKRPAPVMRSCYVTSLRRVPGEHNARSVQTRIAALCEEDRRFSVSASFMQFCYFQTPFTRIADCRWSNSRTRREIRLEEDRGRARDKERQRIKEGEQHCWRKSVGKIQRRLIGFILVYHSRQRYELFIPRLVIVNWMFSVSNLPRRSVFYYTATARHSSSFTCYLKLKLSEVRCSDKRDEISSDGIKIFISLEFYSGSFSAECAKITDPFSIVSRFVSTVR